VAIGIIVNELVMNAVKSPTPRRRAYHVDLMAGGDLLLSIADDGVGSTSRPTRAQTAGNRIVTVASKLEASVERDPLIPAPGSCGGSVAPPRRGTENPPARPGSLCCDVVVEHATPTQIHGMIRARVAGANKSQKETIIGRTDSSRKPSLRSCLMSVTTSMGRQIQRRSARRGDHREVGLAK